MTLSLGSALPDGAQEEQVEAGRDAIGVAANQVVELANLAGDEEALEVPRHDQGLLKVRGIVGSAQTRVHIAAAARVSQPAQWDATSVLDDGLLVDRAADGHVRMIDAPAVAPALSAAFRPCVSRFLVKYTGGCR